MIEDSYLAEIVDRRSGRPMGPGAEGELVLTTLGRTGSPLLRYRTGDLVRAREAAAGASAGLGISPCRAESGRTDDMAVIRGVNVFPSAVEEVVRSVPGIAEDPGAEVHSAGALLDLGFWRRRRMDSGGGGTCVRVGATAGGGV